MAIFKINWCFINKDTAVKAVDILCAKSLDSIAFYKNNKLADKMSYNWTDSHSADKRAKKNIREFFNKNKGINDFVKFIKI